MFFGCCAEEAEEAAVVTVPVLEMSEEAPAERRAAGEPAAVEQQAAADAPSAEAPAAPPTALAPPPREDPKAPQEFHAALERAVAKMPYGWDIDMLHPDALYIESVSGDASTAVARHNASAPAGQAIRAGDYITRVNGATGSAKVLSEMLYKSTKTQVTIQRPSTYAVELSKNGKPLGMDLNHTARGNNLCIIGLSSGVVKEQAPEVSKGHRILRVNGKDLSPKEMLEELKSSALTVSLLRAPVK